MEIINIFLVFFYFIDMVVGQLFGKKKSKILGLNPFSPLEGGQPGKITVYEPNFLFGNPFTLSK